MLYRVVARAKRILVSVFMEIEANGWWMVTEHNLPRLNGSVCGTIFIYNTAMLEPADTIVLRCSYTMLTVKSYMPLIIIHK